jgi:hypothetical protein
MSSQHTKVVSFALRVPKIAIAIAVAAAATTLVKIDDSDIWWHLATGRWIWEHHAVPQVDLFAYTSKGPLAYTEPLAQLYFYSAFAMDGAAGVVLCTALLTLVLALLVFTLVRTAHPTTLSALATSLVLAALHFRLGPKADMFTFLGFAALLVLLARARDARSFAPIVVLLALWANLHRGGTIALPILAIFTASWARERRWPLARACAAVLVLGAGALCLSPAGLGYIASAFDLTTRTMYREVLPEWRAIYARFFWADDPFFTLLLTTWLGGTLVRRKLDAQTATAVATLALAFTTVRFVPLAAIAMAPGVAEALVWVGARLEGLVRPALRAFVGSAASLGLLGACFVIETPRSSIGLGPKWWALPVDAAAFLKENPPPGRMFNAFDFGGYLAFALAPDQKVFIDGRNDTVYTRAFFADYVRADRDPAALFALLDHWDVTYAVVECSTLACSDMRALQSDPRWVPVYFDDVAVILVKVLPTTEPYLARHAYSTLRPIQALPRLLQLDRDPMAALVERDVLKNVREAPRSMRAQYMAAVVHAFHGRSEEYAAARAAFVSLAAARDSDLAPP